MSGPAPFDLVGTPLRPGVTLLEASAGTGKTYTIAGLYLRLLLEGRLALEQILVVTFTNAATAELRLRIRRGLVAARQALATGAAAPGDGPLVESLLVAPEAQRADWRARLEIALERFDAAAVFTIHGFCQRLLGERAFESGHLFDTELATDVSGVWQAVADDYWRRHFQAAAAPLLLAARQADLGPERMASLLSVVARDPGVRRLTRTVLAPAEAEACWLAAWASAADEWRREAPAIRALFGSATRWGNKPYNSDHEMAELFGKVEALLGPEGPQAQDLSALEAFTPEALAHKRKKKGQEPPPAHPFLGACREVLERAEDLGQAHWAAFLAGAAGAVRARLEQDQTVGFDDLLTRVRDALRGPGGEALRAVLRRRHGAALIDEFQDTDPVQFEIFERAFTPAGDFQLYLVGDPKQAIYSFRGADIFAYLGARRLVDREYTLGDNFRSAGGLVWAVNALFDHPRPFGLAQIGFHPVTARGRADEAPLTEDGVRRAPLQVWYWDPGEKCTRKPDQEERLAEAVAAEVVRLLAGGTRLGDRPLAPAGLAVLVDKHEQAERVRRALARRGVPAVQQTQGSVWETDEAADLDRVLRAMDQPAREDLVRGALATRFLGVDAAALEALGSDDLAWEAQVTGFLEWRRRWEEDGFFGMFEDWLRDRGVRHRLLAEEGGERRLTNVLHLGELLHRAAAENRLGRVGLLQWLAGRRARPGQDGDAELLRLERDDAAVQLVTIHRSKGLEYDVVFCPFLFRPATTPANRAKQEWVMFHDPAADGALTLDLGSAAQEDHRQAMYGERFAENLRLLYVALTRARHRAYLVWGPLKDAAGSAPGWLLQPPGDPVVPPLSALPRLAEEHVEQGGAVAARAAVEALAGRAAAGFTGPGPGPVEVLDLPDPDATRHVPPSAEGEGTGPRPFRAVARRPWGVTSFTGLVRNAVVEEPDRDAGAHGVTSDPEAVAEAPDPLEGFRGAEAGVCLHALFEEADFAAPADVHRPLVERVLRAHGFDPARLGGPVLELLRRTLATPLPGVGRLADLPAADRRAEMEFLLPLRFLTPAGLQAALASPLGEGPGGGDGPSATRWLDGLEFRPVEGFLRGFIDLVFRHEGRFHLLDWKSNVLGRTPADYPAAVVGQAMAAERYHLQYHLYAVALDAHLRARLPDYDYDRHFGGVMYLFVRGLDPACPGQGVFAHRPDRSRMEVLRRVLVAGKDAP